MPRCLACAQALSAEVSSDDTVEPCSGAYAMPTLARTGTFMLPTSRPWRSEARKPYTRRSMSRSEPANSSSTANSSPAVRAMNAVSGMLCCSVMAVCFRSSSPVVRP